MLVPFVHTELLRGQPYNVICRNTRCIFTDLQYFSFFEFYIWDIFLPRLRDAQWIRTFSWGTISQPWPFVQSCRVLQAMTGLPMSFMENEFEHLFPLVAMKLPWPALLLLESFVLWWSNKSSANDSATYSSK